MQLGQESINAFNEARNAARQRFGWQESARPIEAALNGAQPDKFVANFVIRGSVADASAVARNAPTEEVKNAILAHLKEKSLGGAADEVGKFSQSAYNKALNQIGDRKLALFFTPEEVNQLRTVGRVASYMQNQPVGSAVNNSNSGALLLGKGLDVLNSIPVIGPPCWPCAAKHQHHHATARCAKRGPRFAGNPTAPATGKRPAESRSWIQRWVTFRATGQLRPARPRRQGSPTRLG